jgi:predicted site-specific integrase-resolvase
MAVLALPTYISISEAAERYQLGREALTHLVEAGKLRAVEVDGSIMVAAGDVNVADVEAISRTDLDLPTYILVSEAVNKYNFESDRLNRLVEAGKIRAVQINGGIAVAEEDVSAVSMKATGQDALNLPTYITIGEAAKKYHLEHDTLGCLVRDGKIQAVEVDGNIAVAEEDVSTASAEAAIQDVEFDESLKGHPIRVTEAADKYGVSHANLSRWADTGYIQIIERAPRLLLLDEADVRFAVEVFKQARMNTGSYVRAGWMLKRALEQRGV